MARLRIALLYGGKSPEHEVSLRSARNVFHALDASRYEPVLIGVDGDGAWHPDDPGQIASEAPLPRVPSEGPLLLACPGNDRQLFHAGRGEWLPRMDVFFPVLHGPNGEDGTMQGLFKLLDTPFVGPSVLGSAVGMDKEAAKLLLSAAHIPNARFFSFRAHDTRPVYAAVVATLGTPLFVKPANAGSSIGVHKVTSEADWDASISDAFQFDTKILVEEAISGREIECSVLGNETPRTSVPGEVIPAHEFYSYEAKYLDENGARLAIPADLSLELQDRVRSTALAAYRALQLEGMARVDCFLRTDGSVLVNEVNTLPGFTSISMYPKLWEASGLSYAALVDELIALALRRHERDRALKMSYGA